VQQAAAAKDARVLVRILSESRRSRVGALDRNGKIIATELFLDLRFDARDATGKVLVEPRILEISRTFENADVEVLGKQLEAEILYAEMAQDAATQVLAMLRAALPAS
jgi:LPS-assembly lipoprotein